MTRLLKDFATGYLVAVVLIVLFALAVAYFLDIETPLGVSFVPFIVGVQVAAQRYARRTGQEVAKGFAWRAAIAMTGATLALAALLTAGYALIFGIEAAFGATDPSSILPAIAMIVVILFLIHAVIGRFVFSFMVRTALRAEALKK